MDSEVGGAVLTFFKENGYNAWQVYGFFVTGLLFWRLPDWFRHHREKSNAKREFDLRSRKSKEKIEVSREKRQRKQKKGADH